MTNTKIAPCTQETAFAALFVEEENIAFQKKADNRRPTFLRYPFGNPVQHQFMVINPFKDNAPNRAQEHIAHRNGVVVEMDTISLALQRAWFASTLGNATVSVFSGNKSVHNMISCTASMTTAQEEEIIPMFKKLLPFADYLVLQDSARLCRTPGATRDNGNIQTIESVGTKWDVDALLELLKTKTSQLSKIPYMTNSGVKKLHHGKIKVGKETRPMNDDDRRDIWKDILQDMIMCGYPLAAESFEYQALQEQSPFMPKDFDLNEEIKKARETDQEIRTKKTAKKVFAQSAAPKTGDIGTWIKTQLSQMSDNDLLNIIKKYYSPDKVNERGKNIALCCVFHSDKTPSAYIATHEDGIPKYHCSSCGFAGKDAIDIVTEAKPGISIIDACQEVFGHKPPIYCNKCSQEIIFNNRIPCEPDGKPHQCPNDISVCNRCGQEIKWKEKKPYNLDDSRHTHKRETTTKTATNDSTSSASEMSWIDEKGKIITGIAAESFIESTQGNLIYSKENFYEFTGGVWKIIDDRVIAYRIRTMIGCPKSRQTIIKDVAYQITIILLQKCEKIQLNAFPNKLCFINGILDLDTFQFEPHNPLYYQTIQLPYEYKPIDITSAEQDFTQEMFRYAPQWMAFLCSLGFLVTTLKRIQEWFGYCLVPSAKIERCLYLKGEGSNGKSTMLEVLIGILGQEQVTSLEPQELFDRFKVSLIQDRLANVCSDIETSLVLDARFKKLVSGEEQIGEEKNKKPFKFRPYARFIFSANDFIPTRDRSHAFFRRFDVIEFKRIFTDAEQDKDLKKKLIQEIPYIINWALRGLASLRANNWNFSESQEFADTKAEFESAVNPVKQFVDETIIVTTNPDEKIKCDSFREKYTNWCKANGYEVMAENKLGRELKRLGIEKRRIREGNCNPYWYLRVCFS